MELTIPLGSNCICNFSFQDVTVDEAKMPTELSKCLKVARKAFLGDAKNNLNDNESSGIRLINRTRQHDMLSPLIILRYMLVEDVQDRKKWKNAADCDMSLLTPDSSATAIKGLRNLGNTCFFNSIMQVLLIELRRLIERNFCLL